jgi:adenylate cyclase
LTVKFDAVGRLRLYSGMVLYVYVTMHLLNHALGLISLEAMEWGREPFLAVWRNPVGTILLIGSLAIHAGLSLYTLYRRRTLRMPLHEAVQVVSGLLLPPLLAGHVIGNRLLHEKFGVEDTYTWVLLNLWVFSPQVGVQQAVAMILAWTHGTLGLRRYLMLKPWFSTWRPVLFSISILVPLLSLLGFAQGGREVILRLQSPMWFADVRQTINWPDDDAVAWYLDTLNTTLTGMAILFILVLAARVGRSFWHRRMGLVSVSYPGGQRVSITKGMSVLEASRTAGIPHAAVCGGRGRCSTCRINIEVHDGNLPAANEDELRVLHRVGVPESVRLACQLRPMDDLQVTPLLSATATAKDAFSRDKYLAGDEREIAVLFADLRAFTKFSEGRLPYDVVFILNQYFHVMGEAIEGAGGRVDKYIGDGIMALFGIESGPERGCQEALAAAQAMGHALNTLNDSLIHQISEPFRMGMGIHAGMTIVGEMGYGEIMSLTAMGDTVNTASRLEAATKEFKCKLVVSQDLAQHAGVDLSRFPSQEIEVRGRSEPVAVYLISEGLESLLERSDHPVAAQ